MDITIQRYRDIHKKEDADENIEVDRWVDVDQMKVKRYRNRQVETKDKWYKDRNMEGSRNEGKTHADMDKVNT